MVPNQVILWWEWRRIVYNLLLFVIGVASIFGFEFLMGKALPPGEDAEEPIGLLIGVLAYAFVANACYTVGWLRELYEHKTDPVRGRKRGRRNYIVGVAVSCLLTTSPVWYACLYFASNRPK